MTALLHNHLMVRHTCDPLSLANVQYRWHDETLSIWNKYRKSPSPTPFLVTTNLLFHRQVTWQTTYTNQLPVHQLLAKDKVCFVADWDTICSCCFSPAGTSWQVWKRCIFIHFLAFVMDVIRYCNRCTVTYSYRVQTVICYLTRLMLTLFSVFCIQEILSFAFLFLSKAVIFVLNALTLLVGHQEEHLACKKLRWAAGMVTCVEQGANNLYIVKLMPLPPHHLLLH